MFISVQLIDHYYATTTIKLPLVNHGELRQRISNFIQKKARKNLNPMTHSHLCKKLFQNSHCELVAFPQRKLDRESVSCGNLLVCSLFSEKGVVLCFIPSTNRPCLRLAEMTQKFKERDYPNCSEASTCLFPIAKISFLVCEEGMINVDTNGFCTLQGLKISLLRYNNVSQTLFCKKNTSNLLIQSPCLMGEMSSDHILVDCVCKDKNFCFQIGIPVFSEKEVDAKVCFARQARTTALNLHSLTENRYLRFIKIFPYESSTHHVAGFPHPMFLSLPFGFIEGGQLLFSQKKDGILKCTIISNLFVYGEKKNTRCPATFHDWQIKNPSYDQTILSTKNIICFSDSLVTIVRKGNSKELFVLGAQVQLTCSLKGLWGICFSRDDTSSSSGLQSEATTFIPCIKKKSSFVIGQAPSHSAQSSLDCDPEEGPSQGSRSRSDCDTFHKYSSIKPLALQSSMSMQAFDRGEQPGASSSSFVEPAKKRFRKEKPSQSAMDESRREDEAKRECAESLMLLCSQEQPE